MILRNLTIKIQGNRATTDSPVYLYQYDKNIHLIIDIKNCKYTIANNMYISSVIVKPNNEVVVLNNCFMKNNKAHIILEANLFDGEEEVGTALCQLKLYDNTRTSTIALPPFAIHVLDGYGEPIEEEEIDVLLTQDELRLLTENELALRLEDNDVQGSIKISELPVSVDATGFIPVVQDDTSYKYNLGSLATKHYTHDYVASAMSEMSTIVENVEQMAVSIEGKADESELEELREELNNHTHEEYATVNHTHTEYANVNHTHEEYLTEHQDLSHLALKTEVPSIEGLATTQYVDEAIANVDTGGGSSDVDLSGYVTTTQLTTELNKKANATHTHDEYIPNRMSNEYLYSWEGIQTFYPYANTLYYYVKEGESFESFIIQLPTSGFTLSRNYEFHIFYDATEFSSSTYKRNITVTGGTVKWQSGTSLEIDSQHIYEIILTYIPRANTWLGGVVLYG